MVERRTSDDIMSEKLDKKFLKVQTDRDNEAIKYLKSKSITETSNFIRAASVWVVERIGLKKVEHRKKNKPRWKRRIEGDIKRLREEVSFPGKVIYRRTRIEEKIELIGNLNERYRVKSKGLKTVIEELEQRMLEKNAKIKRYEQRIE